jgi:hypothetical protein
MASGFMRSGRKSVPTLHEAAVTTLRVDLSDIKIHENHEGYLPAISPKSILSVYRAICDSPLHSLIGSIIINVSFAKFGRSWIAQQFRDCSFYCSYVYNWAVLGGGSCFGATPCTANAIAEAAAKAYPNIGRNLNLSSGIPQMIGDGTIKLAPSSLVGKAERPLPFAMPTA